MRKLNHTVTKATAVVAVGLMMLGMSTLAAVAKKTNMSLVNVSTGFCLDSNGKGKVYAIACNGGNYQNWTRSGKRLINVSTGACLDSDGEGKVYAIACNGGNYQNWTRSGKRLINVSTGACLDSNGDGKVYAIGCNGGNYQNWDAITRGDEEP